MGVIKRKIVGVMGSGQDSHEELAGPVGKLIAESGCHLLTGGAGGVMASVSRAFCQVEDRAGICLGVIRSKALPEKKDNRRNYQPSEVNPWVEAPIYTPLDRIGEQGEDFLSRNHINVLTADVLIALPGGAGTLSEIRLRVQYGRKALVYIQDKTIWGLKGEDFETQSEFSDQVTVANSLNDLLFALKN